jgi:hypothetical protein
MSKKKVLRAALDGERWLGSLVRYGQEDIPRVPLTPGQTERIGALIEDVGEWPAHWSYKLILATGHEALRP